MNFQWHKMNLSTWGARLFLVLTAAGSASGLPTLPDDRPITVTSANAAARRQALITYVWGTPGFPANNQRLPPPTTLASAPADLTPPGTPLANIQRIDKFSFTTAGPGGMSVPNIAYHLIPVRKNNKVVIMNPGHACSYTEQLGGPYTDTGYGDLRALNALLREGYSVFATYMPRVQPGDCGGTAAHNSMMQVARTNAAGSPLKHFLDPVARGINYLKANFPQYTEFDFVGLSGGGWTAVVYAAVDPRIKVTIQVAGSIPLYYRNGGVAGDAEQLLPDFYTLAGYPDLYVLGSFGADRRQVQVLNRRDDCCFSERAGIWNPALGVWHDEMRKTESAVRTALFNMGSTTGAGFFRLELDESIDHHGYSWSTITNAIIAELNHSRRPIGAVTASNAFVRGLNGNLWQRTAGAWIDTNLPMVGAPAVVEGGPNTIDIFYRDPTRNLLMHGYQTGGVWRTEQMGGQIVTDPVVSRSGANPIFVTGLGYDYKLYWWSIPGDGTYHRASDTFLAVSQPAIAAGPNAIHLFARGYDNALYHLQYNSGTGPTTWTQDTVGGDNSDYPSAAMNGATPVVYVRGVNSGHFWEASKPGASWVWTDISLSSGAPALRGSPSVSFNGGIPWVDGVDTLGNLIQLRKNSTWTHAVIRSTVSGAPVAVGSQTFLRGGSGQLWRYDGTSLLALGGLLFP